MALTRPHCLYCGAALGAEQVAAAEKSAALAQAPPGATSPSERHLVVLAPPEAPREVLARALGLSLFEAGQRCLRGGYQLHRATDPDAALRERKRLVAEGVEAIVVPEAEARLALQPDLALGGRWEGPSLRLRLEAVPDRLLAAGAVLLIVKGPITRALEPEDKRMRTLGRVLSFTPTRLFAPREGHRVHLHLADEARPIELDPESFDFGAAPLAASSTLELKEWLATLAPDAAVDDSFRLVTPALGPTEEAMDGASRALERLRTQRDDAVPLYDNVAQFRFFSGWRGAVERHLQQRGR